MESLSQLPLQAQYHEISRFQSLQSNPKFTINFTSSINFTSPNCLKPRWASSISQIQPPKISATNTSVWRRATSRRAKNHRNLQSSDQIDVAFRETNIHGYCKVGRTKEAARGLQILEESGAVPHVMTYTVLIRSYCKDRNVDEALRLLDRMRVAPNVVTYNTLLKGLRDSGKMDKALEMFSQMQVAPSVVTYTTLLKGMCDSGKTEQGRELLAKMKDKGLKPDIVTYTSLVTGLAREGNLDEAIDLLKGFKDLGITPTMITFRSIMSGLCKTRQADRAIDFLGYMVCKGWKPDEVCYGTLIRGIASEGLAKEALELLKELDARELVKTTWAKNFARKMLQDYLYNMLVKGCDSRKTEQGRELVAEMKDKGIKPDDVTYTSLATGLARGGNLDEAIDLLESFKDLGITPTMIAFRSIMSGLCKARQADRAIDFLGYMVCKGWKPDEVCYGTLIRGIASEGLAKEALELLKELDARELVKTTWANNFARKMQQDYFYILGEGCESLQQETS